MVRRDKSRGNPQQENGWWCGHRLRKPVSLHGSSEQAARETPRPIGWGPLQELVATKVLSAWRPFRDRPRQVDTALVGGPRSAKHDEGS